jgi:hypothetical protein
VYSFLFQNNFVDLVNRGISVIPLLESNIFCHEFDYDEWPTQHCHMTKEISPYNGSMFKLRFEYPNVFRTLWLEEQEKEKLYMMMGDKPYVRESRIIYQLNILLSVS